MSLDKNGPRLSLVDGLHNYPDYDSKREFIERKMQEQIDAGTFYLSEWMMLPGNTRDIVGDIVLGRTYEDGRYVSTAYRGFEEISVKLYACDKKSNILVKVGIKKDPVAAIHNRAAMSKGNANLKRPIDLRVPNIHEYEVGSDGVAELPIYAAYLALKQCGWLVARNNNAIKANPGRVYKEVEPKGLYNESKRDPSGGRTVIKNIQKSSKN
jgi:hypothetical protein